MIIIKQLGSIPKVAIQTAKFYNNRFIKETIRERKVITKTKGFVTRCQYSQLFQYNYKLNDEDISTTPSRQKSSLVHSNIGNCRSRYGESMGSSTMRSPIDTPKDKSTESIEKITTKSIIAPTGIDYLKTVSELSKARLSALVVSTSTFGFLAAGVEPLCYSTLAAASLGTALCASSAATLNQIFEIDRDTKMKRTRNRPLVTGKIATPNSALALACLTGTSGTATLLYGADALTATLGMGNIALYAGIYTYLKPRSEWNTWVGALVGAVPPVMGYAAATGGEGIFLCHPEPFIIGATLFLWQFPHFFALSWMHRVDYAKGGFQMIATNDNARGDRTSVFINRYTYYLASMPFIACLCDVTSPMFAIEGILLNGYAIYVAQKFNRDRSNGNARKVFLTSLWYLPCWMVLFLLHSKNWKLDEKQDDKEKSQMEFDPNAIKHTSSSEFIGYLKRQATRLRSRGRELCVHEIVVSNDDLLHTTSSSVQSQEQENITSTTDNGKPSSDKNNSKHSSSKQCPITLIQNVTSIHTVDVGDAIGIAQCGSQTTAKTVVTTSNDVPSRKESPKI